MSTTASSPSADPPKQLGRARVLLDFQPRFLAIWGGLLILILVSAVFLPQSLRAESLAASFPFAAFLAIAAMGQALVIMARGIDLSVPAIVTLASTVLLGQSAGSDTALLWAIPLALLFATLVGLANGLLVAFLGLNALIVTLAVGAITAGLTLWYRQGMQQESSVPDALADFGGANLLGMNNSLWIALALTVVMTILLRKTLMGRHFEAVGSNPRAGRALGLPVRRIQCGAYVAAALLYGTAGILLSAFIRNPTLEVGNPYLLAPIAAAVLAATSINGGIGSMVAVLGAALFLTQLGQMLDIFGLPTSVKMIIEGAAIALGMYLSGFWEKRRQ